MKFHPFTHCLALPAIFALLAPTIHVRAGSAFSYLSEFDGTNGSYPSSIIQASDGNLYGYATSGGDTGNGTVFKDTLTGSLTKMISFNGSNGATPCALTIGTDGNFYGATTWGGANNEGVIFKLTPSGAQAVLHSFNGTGGTSPVGLTEGKSGDFYGVTTYGGAGYHDGASFSGSGVIFKITSSGDFSVLSSFAAGNGNAFEGVLVPGAQGNFYGVTYAGGANGWGSVFSFTPEGTFGTIVSFVGGNGGGDPYTLFKGPNGDFYGTTGWGGTNNSGVLFRMSPSGDLTTLVSFGGENLQPACLIPAKNGGFYGTADTSIFAVSPAGVVTTLAAFDPTWTPGCIIQGRDGNLYGTISGGYTSGAIFKIATVSYSGLFYDTNAFEFRNSGSFNLSLGVTGNFTGTLDVAGAVYSFSGQFDNDTSSATTVIKRANEPSLTLNLQISDTNGAVTGTISDGTDTAQVFGAQAGEVGTSQNPAPQAGKYSLTLLTDSDGTDSPGDGSFGRVTVNDKGGLTLTGMLSDNSVIAQSSAISVSGQWPVNIPLYGGKGGLLGWIAFTNQPGSRFSGTLNWVKTAAYGAYYDKGFTNTVTAIGAIISP